ncbi:hypothetical protein [Streptomyces davaonensis]|uniref:hypothetical protein n=1 Tax=Streptomyces davaonensis TaxID=348043 RepID=UPI00034A7C0D|nr:hypothetical protein [Streptomyces davaonensis]
MGHRALATDRRLGGAFEVRAGAGAVGGGEMPPQPEAVRRESAQLQLYIEDLEVVQRHCEQYFPVPDELAPDERIVLRIARLLVEGHCVVSPFLPRARVTLSGQDSPAVRALLSGAPHALQLRCDEFAVLLAGRRLDLGPVVSFHPRVAAEHDSDVEALAALNAGRSDGHEVTVRPVDGERFRLLLQRSATGPDPLPVPLGLPGSPNPGEQGHRQPHDAATGAQRRRAQRPDARPHRPASHTWAKVRTRSAGRLGRPASPGHSGQQGLAVRALVRPLGRRERADAVRLDRAVDPVEAQWENRGSLPA